MFFAKPTEHRLPIKLEVSNAVNSAGIVHPRDELLGIAEGVSLFLDFREQGTLIGYAKFLLRFGMRYIVNDLAVRAVGSFRIDRSFPLSRGLPTNDRD